MIKITISETEHNICSSWNDVTFLHYCDIVYCHTKPFIERLAIYTGIEADILNKLTHEGVIHLSKVVSFMAEPDAVNGFAYGYEGTINIGHESYEKLEASKKAINDNESAPLKGAVEVVKIYTEKDISNEPVTKSIGEAMYFFDAIKAFMERFKRLNDYVPEQDELEAGSEKLAAFGTWGTAVAYARRTNMTPQEVMKLPAIEVYTTLLLDFEQNEFEKNLNRVKERNRRITQQQGK